MTKPITIKIIEFDPEHVKVMDTDLKEVGHILKMKDLPLRLSVLKESSVQAVTFMYDGRILCCTGFTELWEGVAECWIIPSKHIHSYAMVYAKTIRRYLDQIMKTFKYHRLQTTGLDTGEHMKWMKFLKFADEGCLRGYTSDRQNHRMYARYG